MVTRVFQTAGGNRKKDLWVPRAAAALPCVSIHRKPGVDYFAQMDRIGWPQTRLHL